MRLALIPLFGLVVGLAGCSDLLDTNPVNQVPTDQAITDAASARVALAGAYDGLQSLSFYGGDYIFFNDLYADNAFADGTFNDFADAGARSLLADNFSMTANWVAIYNTINRANNLLEKIPGIADLDDTEKRSILGEALTIRALCYHDLIKVWGNVPMPLVPAKDLVEASQVTTATMSTIYAQIEADLKSADTLMTNDGPRNHATQGAAEALLARVYLYEAKWAEADAEADSVTAKGYGLAPAFGDLFDPEGKDTPEDIFKVSFTAVDYNDFGYYYLSSRQGHGGRHELAPSDTLLAVWDTTDIRYQWSIGLDPFEGRKWRTSTGAEDIHVIRYAEVLLIKAEAQAQQNQLALAVGTYNLVRERAGLPDHVLGVDVTTQTDVLTAIENERRFELAFEGDRFPDLVRLGQAETVLGIPTFRTVFPIPQREVDVAPGITQNPGY
jgi:hypothetical protein